MKKIYLILMLILFTSVPKLFAQWEKVADYNVGATGQMAMHDSTVFLYGYQGAQFVYRSTDNGNTWTNNANKFPDKVYYVHGHGNYVFSIVGINNIYYSTDDGVTWNSRSTVPLASGAVLSLISDGTALYALSNRASVFKSTDNGLTWSEITISYSQAQVLGYDFAAVGNTMVFSAINLGSFLSTDGGVNWRLKNPALIIGSVHSFRGELYGSTYGMYKLVADTGWQSMTSGFPSGIGVTGSTKGTISVSNKLFTYYTDVVLGSSKVFGSNDKGNNWSETGTGLTPAITTSLNNFMAASPSYLYCYVYSLFTPNATGVYRIPLQNTTTSIENVNGNVPNSFSLKQNYPNPFNPSTTIKFSIPKSSFVSLKVYDVLGKEVALLVNENLNEGTYNYNFDASKLSSGIYFYTIRSENFVQTKKMIMLK